MNINLIGVPLFYGADKRGNEYAPQKLREKNIINLLTKHGHTVYDCGNVNVPHIKEDNKFSHHPKMKYLKTIVEVNTNLAHLVASSLHFNCFPLIIGGDHSVGLGSISGASKIYNNLAVIWFDAHGDLNTYDTTFSGNVHGMPLSSAMGLGHEDLANVYFKGKKVKPENIFIIGARDLDSGENMIIENEKINVYSPEYIREKGIENISNDIMQKLHNRNIEAIHLSFDLDFLDSTLVAGTGTPVKDGMSIREAKTFFKTLAQTKLIKSMDFVEFNTLLDVNDATADISIDLLNYIFKYL
ncbi:arginase [Lutibacter sp. B2]|nr:arginase [Lutibacter sp. B2]